MFRLTLPVLLLAGTLSGCAMASAYAARPVQSAGASNGASRRGGTPYPGMGRAAGEVTAISGNTLTVRDGEGASVQVLTTNNTQFMKESGPVRLTDMRLGDGLMAIGNMDPATHTLHAAMVMAEDAAQVKTLRDNLGKTYITGRVTAVNLDDARMTIERPDRVTQTIVLDEGTSFRRAVRRERTAENGAGGVGFGRGAGGGMGIMASNSAGLEQMFKDGESITLADIKVGDHVIGSGAVKGGSFVPLHLLDSPPGQRRRGESGGTNASGAAAGPDGR